MLINQNPKRNKKMIDVNFPELPDNPTEEERTRWKVLIKIKLDEMIAHSKQLEAEQVLKQKLTKPNKKG